jgi:hypothetical protein
VAAKVPGLQSWQAGELGSEVKKPGGQAVQAAAPVLLTPVA